MIQYSLKCAEGHRFDSWFQSAAAFEKLQGAGMVTCASCGTSDVRKELMAPAVRPARSAARTPAATTTTAPDVPAQPAAPGPLSAPASDAEKMVAELKRKVEQSSDYVGRDFAAQARAMHDGDTPARSIYGEAGLEEARSLVEDGVPILPLPFRPSRKDN